MSSRLRATSIVAMFDPSLPPTATHASKKPPVFMRVSGVAQLIIETPNPPNCHPEREGGGSGGREGSPHKSWCRSTVIAEILRSPRAHPPIAHDDIKIYSVSSLKFSARAVKRLRMTQTFVSAI